MNVARRFSIAYLGLAALLGVAIGTLVVLIEQPAPKPPPPWSAWQPNEASRVARQQQIASHVGSQYHLDGGKRLVRVVVRDPDASPDPIRDVALARNLDPRQQSDVLGVVDSTKTAMYILCGDVKAHCAIKDGEPSVARGTVLRREALELALYTFRYVDGVDAIVAFLPPKPNSPPYAVFFKKDDLDSQLDHPLMRTLPQRKPPMPGKLSATERKTVDDLTLTRYFRFELQRANNGARVLVLRPAAV